MEQLLAVIVPILSNEAFLAVVLGIGVHFYRQFRGDKANKELQAFDLSVKLAYDGVRNWAALFPGEKVNKAAKGLEIFSKALKTELGREPTSAEVASAQLHFDAAHAEEAEQKARMAKWAADPGPLVGVQGTAGNVVASVPSMPLG